MRTINNQTDTPRTDAEIEDARNVALEYQCSPQPDAKTCEVVHADFARSIEREMRELRQQRDRLADALRGLLKSGVCKDDMRLALLAMSPFRAAEALLLQTANQPTK